MDLRLKLVTGIAIAALGSSPLVLAGGAGGAHLAAPAARSAVHAGGLRMPAPGVAPAVTSGATTSYAYNWSGYAQTDANGTYKGIADTWTVPTVNTSLSGDQYSSDWVGIDGYSNGNLVQAGTEGDNIGGKAHYDAWTEIIPAAEVVLPGLAIKPGNQIETIVLETSPNAWLMEVENLTTGQSGSRTVHYVTPGASAETVHERPCIAGDCSQLSDLATLSKTGNVTFDPGLYTTSYPPSLLTANTSTVGWSPLLSGAPDAIVYRIFMLNDAASKIIAAPSVRSSDDEGFSIAYGATAPPAP
jgi:hypothetical protein